MKRIVLFASGAGSNVENIVHYFHGHPKITIACVLTNKRNAKVLDRCNALNISSLCFNKTAFTQTDCVLNVLQSQRPDLIVLAGFLWKIPAEIIKNFPDKIINIHPALLPNYGGKGMYGMKVHEAIKENKEPKTGITIHYVNENYDEGAIIRQISVQILSTDSTETIAQKVHELEYEYFPRVIEQLLEKQ